MLLAVQLVLEELLDGIDQVNRVRPAREGVFEDYCTPFLSRQIWLNSAPGSCLLEELHIMLIFQSLLIYGLEAWLSA